MTPLDIKILLLKKGITQADIARSLKVTPGMINGLIKGRFKSRRLQEEIAALLRVEFKSLWEQKAA